jgi:DNA-binding transcriptional LysR family regulator
MQSHVELRELRTFLALAEELHFARAAERLGLTPSRVSQTIATLETRIGTRLFDRTSRRVSLTPRGESLLADVRPHVDGLEQALNRARANARGIVGTLRVGSYMRAVVGRHFPEIIRRFEARYPGAKVVFTDFGIGNYLDYVRRGRYDIVAGRLPVSDPDITVGPILTREERMLLVPRDNPLATYELVTLEDIADSGLPVTTDGDLPEEMMRAFVPPVTPSGRRLPRGTKTIEEALIRVAMGNQVHPTVASFFDFYSNPAIVGVKLDLPPSETALIWHTAQTSPLIQAFADIAAEVTSRHGLSAPASSPREPNTPSDQ